MWTKMLICNTGLAKTSYTTCCKGGLGLARECQNRIPRPKAKKMFSPGSDRQKGKKETLAAYAQCGARAERRTPDRGSPESEIRLGHLVFSLRQGN